ncbi:hypothetical protein CRX72_21595 [Pantoea sp. BRM17]|nr:hypothetical protein CRX72_21595 [Pantoea sp. BRM17]
MQLFHAGKKIGNENVWYGNPHKVEVGTTQDIYLSLPRSEVANVMYFYAMYSEKTLSYNGITQNNRNGLLWDQHLHVDGMKTGHTESAGFNIVASSVEGRHRLIAVIMGGKHDACVALADYVAGSQESFVTMMNHYVQKLGLTHTHFETVHGLDAPGQHTTARDLAVLSRAIINGERSKLMTGYVVDRAVDQGKITRDDVVTVGKDAWAAGNPVFKGSSLMFLKPGDKVTVRDLMRGVIIDSGYVLKRRVWVTLSGLVFVASIAQADDSLAFPVTAPGIDAASWVLMDATTGQILTAGNPDAERNPASLRHGVILD